MEPRDLPKLRDIIMEIHASRMVIRDYESRLDRLECSAAEAYERRYQRHAPQSPRNESSALTHDQDAARTHRLKSA